MLPRKDRLSWLAPTLLVALTAAAFWPALRNGFVIWDDDFNLLNNTSYRGLGWTQLRWMFTTFHGGHYQPLSWLTLAVDFRLWGMDPRGYHLTSLLLHAGNALLFYFICLRLLGAAAPGSEGAEDADLRLSAVLAALLFAVHPLRVESVAWATERRDVLSGFFYLATVLCHLKSCALPAGGVLERRWQAARLAAFALSLLSKAWGMSLPVVLLVLDAYPLRRLPAHARQWLGPEARPIWREKIPYFLLALAAAAAAFIGQKQSGALISIQQHGLNARLAQAAFGLTFYLWKTLFPFHLLPLYELPARVEPLAWPFWFCGASVLGLTALLVRARARWPAGLACWAVYAATLSPVLGLAQSGLQLAADRYTYLSCLGGAVLAGGGFLRCWRVLGAAGRRNLLAVLAAAAGALTLMTWRQTRIWRDSESLWRYVLSIEPEHSVAHENLGAALAAQGRFEEAERQFRESLRIKPHFAEAHNDLGSALARQGRPQEAIREYQEAIRYRADYADPYFNIGTTLAGQDRTEEAIPYYREALKLQPDHPFAHNNLGNALADRSRLDEALGHYREAVRLRTDYVEAYNNMAAALFRQGKLVEAVRVSREALRIAPDHAVLHKNLANILLRQGGRAEAVRHYREALRIDPDYAEARNNLEAALKR